MCTTNINTLEIDRQVFWQTNYLNSFLLADLNSCNTLPSRPIIANENIIQAPVENESKKTTTTNRDMSPKIPGT